MGNIYLLNLAKRKKTLFLGVWNVVEDKYATNKPIYKRVTLADVDKNLVNNSINSIDSTDSIVLTKVPHHNTGKPNAKKPFMLTDLAGTVLKFDSAMEAYKFMGVSAATFNRAKRSGYRCKGKWLVQQDRSRKEK